MLDLISFISLRIFVIYAVVLVFIKADILECAVHKAMKKKCCCPQQLTLVKIKTNKFTVGKAPNFAQVGCILR